VVATLGVIGRGDERGENETERDITELNREEEPLASQIGITESCI